MIEVTVLASILLLLLVLVIWVARKRTEPVTTDLALLPIQELFPLHYKHLPQVLQALSPADDAYLRNRASPKVRRQTAAERHHVALQFLAGLREDFSRLDQLGRTVASLSPQVSRRHEAERLWLRVRFWFLYRLVWLRLTTGSVPLKPLGRLTELIGNLAAQIEASMAVLAEASAKRAPNDTTA